MNVFADLHHGDLHYALHLLFEKRLEMNLFRPIGLDWFKRGFWKLAESHNNPPDIISQYLEVPPANKKYIIDKCDKIQVINDIIHFPISKPHIPQEYGETQVIDGVYHIPTKMSDGYYIQKAITLEQFLKMDIDFVIATWDGHEQIYSKLVSKFKPTAKFIFQIGNVGWKLTCAKNVLLSRNISLPSDINYIKYHPEHHEDYCYTPPANSNLIRSFIHSLQDFPESFDLFTRYEKLLPELIWKMHGDLGRDGIIPNDSMPQIMRDSAFIWHVKQHCGGGFVARQAMACGRPPIIRSSYAEKNDSLELDLYEDSVNCIDLDLGTEKENIEKIRYFMQPKNHVKFCESTVEDFKRKIDFDDEARQIKAWLERLI